MDENVTIQIAGLKEQVPVLGYRNYWYPAIPVGKLGKNPQHVKLLGDDVVLYRDLTSHNAYAMADRCPHRNARLSEGNIFFPGTLSCPYHGWTFDTAGNLVAVLTEGPDCPMVGKIRQRTYPVREFRGFIWIWMGDGEPVPLEEDLPPEISDPANTLFSSVETWNANWRPVTENTDGYHAPILHYNSMPRVLFMSWVAWRRTTYVETDDKLGLTFAEIDGEDKTHYPGLGGWPRYPAWKYFAKKLFRAKTARGRPIDLRDGKTGARMVPLTPAVAGVLAEIPRVPDNPWVIAGQKPGAHMTNVNDPWLVVRARAGLEDVRIHDLRHSWASRALALGESLSMIGKLLGHNRIETTARYAHLARDTEKASAAKIGGSIGADILPADGAEAA